MSKAMTRVGIVGYGNLGRGVEAALEQNPDMALVGIFTRRSPASITPRRAGARVLGMEALDEMRDAIDVLILCGGSHTDLPVQSPALAARFNVVDSFDTHARIEEHFDAVDAAARGAGRTAVIAAGWDPGLFSLARLYGEAILPRGSTYTFWGPGLSQGHSDAIRRVPGVKMGVQYTLPVESAVARVRAGERPELVARQMHTRDCHVVLEEGADPEAVRKAIQTMPHYFADYETTVTFVSEEEFLRKHTKMPHGGSVIRAGDTGDGNKQVMELRLALESNPEFTANVLVACARACHRLYLRHDFGGKTIFDIAPALLSPRASHELRVNLL